MASPKLSSELIAELRQAGIKFTSENLVAISKLPNGKIIFLETGNTRAALLHIQQKHGDDFLRRGILMNQIPNVIMAAITQGKVLGRQGVSRTIYEVAFESKTQYISIDVGSNGYIIGANPTPRKLILRLTQGET